MLNKCLLASAVLGASMLFATASLAGGPSVASTTAITSDTPDPSVAGALVTLSATVTPATPATCFGTVTFTDQTAASPALCSALTTATDPAVATCSASFAGPDGPHDIVATYVSSSVCIGSASAITTHTVTGSVVAVPTVGEWTMWGLAGLIALGGGVVLSRRARRFV